MVRNNNTVYWVIATVFVCALFLLQTNWSDKKESFENIVKQQPLKPQMHTLNHKQKVAPASVDIAARFKTRRDHLLIACKDPDVSSINTDKMVNFTKRENSMQPAIFGRLKFCPIRKCGSTTLAWTLPKKTDALAPRPPRRRHGELAF